MQSWILKMWFPPYISTNSHVFLSVAFLEEFFDSLIYLILWMMEFLNSIYMVK